MIQTAIKTQYPSFTIQDYLHGSRELNLAGALLYSIVYDYEHESYPEKEKNREYIKAKIVSMFDNNKAPTFINSHNWGYSALCQSFALIKNKEELWNLFSSYEQEQITQCMKMFLFMWNFGCNANNNYHSGWGLHGNYAKIGSPNYELTNNMLLPFLMSFFNDTPQNFTNMNELLVNLHWGKEKANLERLNLLNAFKYWHTPGVVLPDGHGYRGSYSLITSGGACVIAQEENGEINYNYKGTGKGVKIPIEYDSRSIYYYDNVIEEIIDTVFKKCFDSICVSEVAIDDTDIICSTITKITSPYEGQIGMMKEFNSHDINTRSSLFHCSIDFVLTVTTVTTLKLLNIVDLTQLELWPQITVGMEDYLFKKENGYQGYSMGQTEKRDPIDISLWKNYWEKTYR